MSRARLSTVRRMRRRNIPARVLALVATVAALGLFALSLTALAGLDGRLAGAVTAERSPETIQVSSDERRWTDDRDCPLHERESAARVRS